MSNYKKESFTELSERMYKALEEGKTVESHTISEYASQLALVLSKGLPVSSEVDEIYKKIKELWFNELVVSSYNRQSIISIMMFAYMVIISQRVQTAKDKEKEICKAVLKEDNNHGEKLLWYIAWHPHSKQKDLEKLFTNSSHYIAWFESVGLLHTEKLGDEKYFSISKFGLEILNLLYDEAM